MVFDGEDGHVCVAGCADEVVVDWLCEACVVNGDADAVCGECVGGIECGDGGCAEGEDDGVWLFAVEDVEGWREAAGFSELERWAVLFCEAL